MPLPDETLYWQVRVRRDLKNKLKRHAKKEKVPIMIYVSNALEDHLYEKDNKVINSSKLD